MIIPILALAPASISWSPKVALVMVICNVIAIAIGKATIKQPNVGLQLPSPNFFGGLGSWSPVSYTHLTLPTKA